MPTMIKVYPTKASALSIPAAAGRPKLTLDGALWPRDSFTMRRLSDTSVTDDPKRAYQPAPVEPAASEPPVASAAPVTAQAPVAPAATVPGSDPAATAAPPSASDTPPAAK